MHAAPISGTSCAPPPDLLRAWPRCAQLAGAFLLGVLATLLGLYCLSASAFGTRPADSDAAPPPGYRIELNTATRGELLQLPGVGPSLAERIEEYRRSHGGFATVDELRQVSGIGPTTLERLRPLVFVRPLEKREAVHTPTPTAAKTVKKETNLTEPINVNTASLQELQKLPGIGPKKAQSIIDARAKKPFALVDDLRRAPGIGPKTLETLRPLVTVGASKGGEPGASAPGGFKQ
jgi:competence protein ComEA